MVDVNLSRTHLDRRLSRLRAIESDLVPPAKGWIRAIRDALMMSSQQLATRMGVTQPNITGLEQAEATGVISLKTLRAAAAAMDCTLVYAFVPRQELEVMVSTQAEKLVSQQLARTDHTMRLENQALTPDDLDAQRLRLMLHVLMKQHRRLWD